MFDLIHLTPPEIFCNLTKWRFEDSRFNQTPLTLTSTIQIDSRTFRYKYAWTIPTKLSYYSKLQYWKKDGGLIGKTYHPARISRNWKLKIKDWRLVVRLRRFYFIRPIIQLQGKVYVKRFPSVVTFEPWTPNRSVQEKKPERNTWSNGELWKL